ncbi:MAG: hypothetical protein V3U75_09305 [Methylococcaceae bacterium]
MNYKKRHLMSVMLVLASFNVQPATPARLTSTVDQNVLFHHHILNFGFNSWDPNQANYLVMFKHAAAMSYDATSFYLNGDMPSDYAGLKRIMNFNAGNAPLLLTFPGKGTYNFAYSDTAGNSSSDFSKRAGVSFDLDGATLEHLKGFACAKSSEYNNFSASSSMADAKRMFQTNWFTGNQFAPVANFQSRFIVQKMVEQTITSLRTGFYDQMFLDEVGRVQPDCFNKEYGDQGSFSSWKEGQLSFIRQITEAAQSTNGRKGSPIKVSGNIWSPYENDILPKAFASNSLPLDHYYFESGGFAIEDLGPVKNGLSSNDYDASTGLPIYKNISGGFIPANRVAVETEYTFHGEANDVGAVGERYMMQHFNGAGIAASQGSWFGWYGESQVDSRNNRGQLVHTHAMMLLRAIPNWENIASVPLSDRWYTKSTYFYWSPNSQFSTSAIQGWNPINETLYVVYMDASGQIDLKGGVIKTAYFVDEVFNATDESALHCLSSTSHGLASLTCPDKVRQGIRITFE